VRRIAHQRQSFAGQPRGVLQAERIGGTLAVERHLTHDIAHSLDYFGQERPVRQLEHARRVIFADGPYQRAAMGAIRPVKHGQQREGAIGIEYLPGDIVMRPGMGKANDDRTVVVIPLRHLEPLFLAAGRDPAFGAHHQRGFEHRAVTQRGGHAELAALARDHVNRRMPCDQGLLLCRLEQRQAQLPVGEHPPQRAVMRRRGEIDPSGLHLVADRDRGNRAAVWLKPIGDTDIGEQVPAGGRNGRGAPVEAFGSKRPGIRTIDHMAGKTLAGSRQCQRHAHQPAADYQEIALFVHRNRNPESKVCEYSETSLEGQP